MKQLAVLFLFFFPAFLAAQACDYSKLYREGKSYAKQRQYKKALYKFNSARRCDPSKGETVDNAIEALLDQVEGEKKRADRERKSAESAKITADNERERANAALIEVVRQQERNERIIKLFYFYDNKIALASKDGKYGFIDKEGNAVIGFNYEEATGFDRYGFATASRQGKEYLLDITGNEYRLVREIDSLDGTVMALDLSRKQLTEIPSKVLANTQLRILILKQNKLRVLPIEIGQLHYLIRLDLSQNELNELPYGIGKLTDLESLDVSNNDLLGLTPQIGQLINLRQLNLSNNAFTSPDEPEDGFEPLPKEIANLTSLYVLNLNYTWLDPKKINELRSLMPWCKISWKRGID